MFTVHRRKSKKGENTRGGTGKKPAAAMKKGMHGRTKIARRISYMGGEMVAENRKVDGQRFSRMRTLIQVGN